jgi:periplasmic protein TonB
MRTAVPLHEFMPYGAPDLIESRRRHLSGALWLASASALAIYALTIPLAALMPATPVVLKPMIVVDPQAWESIVPRPPVPAPAPRIRKPAPMIHDHAPPLPVPDPLAPAIEPTPSGTDRPTPVESSTPVTSTPTGITAQRPEGLPGCDEAVYMEQIPVVIREVRPVYPQIAIDAGVEGTVTVFVLVGKDGGVLQTELSERTQVPMLNEAALKAARQWVFRPGYANGNPVACWMAIPFRFRLH